MSRLFSPIRLNGLELPNRLVIAPMCQYSAEEGCATAWHTMHVGSLANSGAGLFIVEATAVEAVGRITHGCLGLYNDPNEAALRPVVEAAMRYGRAKIGIQLAHAGRKASSRRPWEGKTLQDPTEESERWQTVAPSAIAMRGPPAPGASSTAAIVGVISAFVEATRRSDRLGFDLVELHAAHGYLLHQFLSPLSNQRTDQYGGSRENRFRFPLEIFARCREALAASKPLGVRVSATDWLEGGVTIEDTVAFAQELKRLGCDFIDVSTGGIEPHAKIPLEPGYQVPFASAVKRATGLPTMAVGLITEAKQAEAILAEDKADMIAIARAALDDPHWGWHAAYALDAEPLVPIQYFRAGLKLWSPAVRHAKKAS